MFIIHNTRDFSQNAGLPQTLLLKLAACWLTQGSSFIRELTSPMEHIARSAYCSYLQPFILQAVRVKERFLWNPDKCGNGAHAVREWQHLKNTRGWGTGMKSLPLHKIQKLSIALLQWGLYKHGACVCAKPYLSSNLFFPCCCLKALMVWWVMKCVSLCLASQSWRWNNTQ